MLLMLNFIVIWGAPLLNPIIYKYSMTKNNELRKTKGYTFITTQTLCASIRYSEQYISRVFSNGSRLSHFTH